MNKQIVPRIHFVGGPYDGYEQDFGSSLDDLAARVALPVNENVFLMLAGKPRGPVCPAPTTAIYEIRIDGENARYCFTGTRRSKELSLNWSV